jgi:hypothetical protein
LPTGTGARVSAPKAEENDPMLDWIGLGWQQLYEQNYEMRLRH